jgi:hypothetical protein
MPAALEPDASTPMTVVVIPAALLAAIFAFPSLEIAMLFPFIRFILLDIHTSYFFLMILI